MQDTNTVVDLDDNLKNTVRGRAEQRRAARERDAEPSETVTETVEEERDEEEEQVVTDPPPFLRITASYPAAEYRAMTIQLDMNIGDQGDIGEYEEGDPTALKSWLVGLVTETIAAMRKPERPANFINLTFDSDRPGTESPRSKVEDAASKGRTL